jgi:hypothetical protein
MAFTNELNGLDFDFSTSLSTIGAMATKMLPTVTNTVQSLLPIYNTVMNQKMVTQQANLAKTQAKAAIDQAAYSTPSTSPNTTTISSVSSPTTKTSFNTSLLLISVGITIAVFFLSKRR